MAFEKTVPKFGSRNCRKGSKYQILKIIAMTSRLVAFFLVECSSGALHAVHYHSLRFRSKMTPFFHPLAIPNLGFLAIANKMAQNRTSFGFTKSKHSVVGSSGSLF